MRSSFRIILLTLALACGLGFPANSQSEAPSAQTQNKQPGPGEDLPISAGNSELKYVTPEYMGTKRFWSDDAPIALGVLAVIAVACGAGYVILKKKKK